MIFSWFKSKRGTNAQTNVKTSEKKVETPVLNTPLEQACQHNDAEQRQAGFQQLTEQQAYFDVLKQGKYPDMRLQAAQALTEEDLLRKAFQLAKQKDKAAARVLKAKLNELDNSRSQAEELKQNLEKALNDITALAASAWSPSYNTSYQSILVRWQQLIDHSSEDQQELFSAAEAKIKTKLDANRPKVEAPSDQQAVCDQLEQLAIAVQQANLVEGQIAVTDWTVVIDALAAQWADSIAYVPAEDNVQQRYFTVSQSLRSAAEVLRVLNTECQQDDLSEDAVKRLYAALKAADWRLGDRPMFFEELHQLIDEVKANNAEQAKAMDEQKGEIHKLLAGLRRAIKEGRLLPARTMAIKLEHLLQNQYMFDVSGYQEQLDALQQDVSKLLDWNEFATAPKYVELIDAMRALAETEISDSQDDAEERQQAIKSIQNAWRELGRNDDAEQWQTFQDLGHKAYEPVQRHFDVQKQIRADNLKSREKMCAKLTEILEHAIENGDYKALEKSMYQARRDWGQYRNIDRKDGIEVKERFDHLIEQIEKLLQPQYEASIGAKEVLINRMEALAAQALDAHTVHQAKELQSAWKLVGITPRKDDQALWTRFNEASGKIFAALRAQRDAEKAQEDALFVEAKACIDEVRALGAEAGDDQLEAIRARFHAIELGEKRGADKINDAFEKAVAVFEAEKVKAQQAQGDAQLRLLARKAALCVDAEAKPVEVRAEVLSAWPEQDLENSRWQKGIEARKADVLAGKVATAEATAHRRMLCIKLEILLDKESPVTDKPIRMEYQLKRLKEGGRDNRSGMEQRHDLIVDWYLSAAAEQAQVASLEQRFEALVKADTAAL